MIGITSMNQLFSESRYRSTIGNYSSSSAKMKKYNKSSLMQPWNTNNIEEQSSKP